ncbi:ABC transporter substrate-binding protein [Streptosporangium carneum]|uniref:ABC transporter substrate-binding protein n=1 Tax=Streptosporangium carneum TaxID=47481 RepID=A0A9W6MDM7_9ACTN|nr:ABC transporter substrate-binding protein [Streptosporangium carneum]GLK10090.1 ABC transporter substrate-binding protein [Streptosporangium carneum]
MRTPLRAACALAALTLATACGTGADGQADARPDGGGAATAPAAAGAFPAQVVNCGRTVRVTRAPERIVSFFPSNTELLLALGVKDRVAGQVWADQSPPKPAYAADYAGVKVLSGGEVSRETLLAARPDFILADGEYNFDGRKLPTIAELAELGVPVYVDAAFCPAVTGTATLADTERDLDALGALLGVPDRTARAKETVAATLGDVRRRLADRTPVRAAMVQIFDRQLYGLAGGLYSDIVRTAGGVNVLDGQVPPGKNFEVVSVEAVAKADPETIVYHHTDDADRAAAERWIRDHLGQTRAVRDNRLIGTPAADYSGLRAVDGALALARALHPAAF